MTSFFEKLKRGMSIQEPLNDIDFEKEQEKEKKKEKAKKTSTTRATAKSKEEAKKTKQTEKKPDASLVLKEQPVEPSPKKEKEKEKEQPKKIDIKPILVEVKKKSPEPQSPAVETSAVPAALTIAKENWFAEEGELAIDVYQTEKDLVIQSAVAGINPEDLNIVIEKDMIYIKGVRKKPAEEKGDYFTKECFWGPFKREIILPVEVDPGFAEAIMKEGILTIRLPKILRDKKQVIKVKS